MNTIDKIDITAAALKTAAALLRGGETAAAVAVIGDVRARLAALEVEVVTVHGFAMTCDVPRVGPGRGPALESDPPTLADYIRSGGRLCDKDTRARIERAVAGGAL